MNHFKGDRWILVIGKLTLYDWMRVIGVVYGDYTNQEQLSVYNEIDAALALNSFPVLLLGDFNQILNPNERRCQVGITTGMQNFQMWLDNHGPLDLQLSYREFTWGAGNSRSKIDRCVYQVDWLEKFSSLTLSSDRKYISDHVPLIVQLQQTHNWGPRPFRSLNVWFSHPKFKQFVHETWGKIPGWPVHKKLKLLKEPIKEWNKLKFGNIDQQLVNTETQLHELDKIGDSRALTGSEFHKQKQLQVEN